MKRNLKLIIVAVGMSCLTYISYAATSFIGQITQQTNTTQLNGTTVDTNSGLKSAGTQRVVIATDQPAMTNAQPVSQNGTWTVQPGNTANTTAWKVDGSAVTQPVSGPIGLSAGTANIGNTVLQVKDGAGVVTSVGYQTSGASVPIANVPGQNLNVAVNAALPTGSNVIGALSANQSVNAAQVGGNTVLTGNGTTGTGSQRVTIASDNTAFSVNATLQTGTNSVGTVVLGAGTASAGKLLLQTKDAASTITDVGFQASGSSVPVSIAISTMGAIGRISATTTSSQLVASNALRKGIECESICTNTDRVFMNLSVSVATINHKPLEVCSSWTPPGTTTYTGPIQVISNSGTQVVICVEYQ